MLIQLDLTVKEEHKVCPFHKANPGVEYAGCTCISVYEARCKNKLAEISEKGKIICQDLGQGLGF